MPFPPSFGDSPARLKAAVWAVGYDRVLSPGGPGWLVTGTNCENAVEARWQTLDEAYWRVCQQAEAAWTPSRQENCCLRSSVAALSAVGGEAVVPESSHPGTTR